MDQVPASDNSAETKRLVTAAIPLAPADRRQVKSRSMTSIWCRSAAIGRSQHVWKVTSWDWAAGPHADLLPGPVPAHGRGG